MTQEYQQTDTNAPFGAIAACSGLSAGTTVDAGLCEVGGTAGVTELVADHPGSGSGTLRLIHFELDVADGTDWDAGNWTVRMGVTTQSSQLIWDSVFICRVNSSGVSQEELASATGLGIKFNLANVSTVVNQPSAATPNAGDRVYIVIGCTNNQTMSNTVGITPSDIITAPFTAAAGDTTGTLAVTQDDQTSSASGTLEHSGTLAITQADQTSSVSGQLEHSGSLAQTQADQTSSASGTASGGGGAIDDDFNSYTDGNTLDSESADWAVWAASGTGVMTLDQHDDHSDLSQVVDMSGVGDNWAIYQTQVGGNDHYAEVDVFLDSLDGAVGSLTAVAGPIVRGSQPNMGDSDFNGYAAIFERHDNGVGTATVILRIYRIDNDVPTVLASSADVAGQSYDASSTTATVRLEIEGDALTAYADGNQLVSTTDSTHSTGQHCGVRLNRVQSETTSQPFIDNFSGDVLAGGGATGSLSETQDAQTLSASGTVTAPTVTGTLAETQDDQTLAASGALENTGTVAQTQDDQTLTASGLLEHDGSLAETQDDQTATASGTLEHSGSLAETQADHTLSATGTVGDVVNGTLDITQDPQTSTAAGSLGHDGTLDVTQADDTLTAAGTLGHTGSLSETQADHTLSASGVVGDVVAGSVDQTQADNTLSASGQLGYTGTTSAAQADHTLSAAGDVEGPVLGSLEVTQDAQTGTATGWIEAVGTLAVTQDDQTLAASGVLVVTGSLAEAQDAQTLAAAGTAILITADLNPIKLSFREPSRHLTHAEAAHVTYQEG